jgi:ATP-dependent DNA helicase RecQ
MSGLEHRFLATVSPPQQATREAGLQILRAAEGSPTAEFREGQWDAIQKIVDDRARLLVVQRTGWGKSMVYFVASELLRRQSAGITLVISPLIALMTNQLEAARRAGIHAVTMHSSNEPDWDQAREDVHSGGASLLVISPEKLFNQELRQDVLVPLSHRIHLVVIDEAHCISDWGHDFRPKYRRIVSFLKGLPPRIPVLATTATANQRVVDDVKEQFGGNLEVMRGPLVRESLGLQRLRVPTVAARLAWLAERVPALPGSGIIYCLTVRDAHLVSQWLQSRGIGAPAYTGQMEPEQRPILEQELLENRIKALVATSALGMGFDKPDLGFVIHFQRPASVIHYYQQVGRAGRKLEHAVGVLLSGEEDDEIARFFIESAFPPAGQIRTVLQTLAGTDGGATLPELEEMINLSKSAIEKVLDLAETMTPSPVTKVGSRYVRTAVPYLHDQARIDQLVTQRNRERQVMAEYLTTRDCLMRFLARELGDDAGADCGKCENCLGRAVVSPEYPVALAAGAADFLRRRPCDIQPRKMWSRGRIPVYLLAQEGRALSSWADGGWGDVVRDGKQVRHRFGDELVAASAELIRQRWRPEPSPEWVACVPSRRTGALVPDFAARLAAALQLPFVACIQKVRDAAPQKTMQNSRQQEHNLDEAFAVDGAQVRPGPVLLVDDIVDSRWTFTVLAAELREAGSGPVWPFALANTGHQGGD